ncbi:hypothetical protein D9758_013910 [Tetrapyrgos nigripes]|uniref:F-box domain-containing protein n=1 Tax=Tetrapyrgos nigripes TaxID=182062 RepID=A0A8H5CMV9_9AGAR|nr:hypothetical protein D9758_013910 [Tetrapyrgos nigripes]
MESQEGTAHRTRGLDESILLEALRTGRPLTALEILSAQIIAQSFERPIGRQHYRIQDEVLQFQELTRLHEQKMGQLYGYLNHLQQEQQMFQSALSPIRKLHPEVLSLIFVTYIDTCTDGNRFGFAKTSSGLSHLSLVCHYWYKIILETPRLWGTISLNLSAKNECLDDITPPLMRHLALSKQALVYLNLHWEGASRYHDMDHYASGDEFLELLAGEQSRWCCVRLHPRVFSIFHDWRNPEAQHAILSQLMRPEFPSLYALDIHGDDRTKLPFFQNCPNLRSLSLSEYESNGLPNLSWAQLTHLSLKSLGIKAIAHAMELCPNIVSAQYPSIAVQVISVFWTKAPKPTLLFRLPSSYHLCASCLSRWITPIRIGVSIDSYVGHDWKKF